MKLKAIDQRRLSGFPRVPQMDCTSPLWADRLLAPGQRSIRLVRQFSISARETPTLNPSGRPTVSILLALALSTATPHPLSTPAQEGARLAYTCLLSGQREEVDRKTCYYNCAGSVETRAVRPYDDCPLSVHK